MTTFKNIIELEYDLIKTFTDWSKVHQILSSHCYCTSVNTDLESYIEVEAEDEKCLDDLCKKFGTLGFILRDDSERINNRKVSERN